MPLTFRDILQTKKIWSPAYPVTPANWTSHDAFRSLLIAALGFVLVQAD